MLIYVFIIVILFLVFLFLLKNKETFQEAETCNIDKSLISGNSIKQCVLNCKNDRSLYENNFCKNNQDIIGLINEENICNNDKCELNDNHKVIIDCLNNNNLEKCKNDSCFQDCVNCNDPSRCMWNYSFNDNEKISGGKLPEIKCDDIEKLNTDVIGNIKLNDILDEDIKNLALTFSVPSDIIDIFDTCSNLKYDKDTFNFIVKIKDESDSNLYNFPVVHLNYNYCSCMPKFDSDNNKYLFRIVNLKYNFKANNIYKIKIALRRNSDILNYKKIEYESNEITLFVQDSLKKIPDNVVNTSKLIQELLQKPIQITI